MEVELSEARLTFETNFFSVINMCQTFLPLLIKAKGTIVQIGSVAGVCILTLNDGNRMTDPDRSFLTFSDQSTMHPRQRCTPLVIPFEWSWLLSGRFPEITL